LIFVISDPPAIGTTTLSGRRHQLFGDFKANVFDPSA